MLDERAFQQRRDKVAEALDRATMAMMTESDEKALRPLLKRINLIERVKPEDTLGAIPGANQQPFSLLITAEPSNYSADLAGDWIDETDPDAMVLWLIEWVRDGTRAGELPSGPRREATKQYPGQDEYGRIIPQLR